MFLLSYKCTLHIHYSILRLQIWKMWQGEVIQCHTMKLGNSCAKASKFCYWVTTNVFVPSFSVKAFAKMNVHLHGRCWLYCFSEISVVSCKSWVQCLCAMFCLFCWTHYVWCCVALYCVLVEFLTPVLEEEYP